MQERPSPEPPPPALTAEGFQTMTPADLSVGSRYHWLTALVVPRPIALVTTVDQAGRVNAAPFSYFQGVASDPLLLMLSVGKRDGEWKDTAANLRASGELVINIVSQSMAGAVQVCSGNFPPDVSEVDEAGLDLLPSQTVKPPRIANCLAHLEARLDQAISVARNGAQLYLCEILLMHVHDSIIDDRGRADVEKLDPLARLAAGAYAGITETFRYKPEPRP